MNQLPTKPPRKGGGWVGKTAVFATAATLTPLIYALRIEPQKLTLEAITIPIPQLHPALEQFRIVQLSDFHLHPHTQLPLIERAVAQANALRPDLIVLTGDFVLDFIESIFALAPALGRLNARYGVFCIMGNHDVKMNDIIVPRGLRDERLCVLRNEGVMLSVGAGKLYLAGVDDGIYGRPNLPQAMARWQSGATTILLAHEPDFADAYHRDPRIALQLSGHTHGGQVNLPGYGPLILPRYGKKYHTGLYRLQQMWLYTNRGIGMGGIPVRFNCPPEITEITLTRAE